MSGLREQIRDEKDVRKAQRMVKQAILTRRYPDSYIRRLRQAIRLPAKTK